MTNFKLPVLYNKIWKIFVQAQRTKFQTTKVKDPHFPRKKMLEVCKPIFDAPVKPDWETCSRNSILPVAVAPHPYERILSEELKKNLCSSRMICFYHLNPISDREYTQIRNTFFKQDMFLHNYSESVVKLSLENSPYSSCLHLYSASTILLFAAEPKVREVLNISKKLTNVLLMAAFIDDVFYSKNQLEKYSKLPSKEGLYQELSCLLNTKLASLATTVMQPTQQLSQYLDQLKSNDNS